MLALRSCRSSGGAGPGLPADLSWELGYCNVFGIPWEFVSVNPVSLVEGLGAMLLHASVSSYVVGGLLFSAALVVFIILYVGHRRSAAF